MCVVFSSRYSLMVFNRTDYFCFLFFVFYYRKFCFIFVFQVKRLQVQKFLQSFANLCQTKLCIQIFLQSYALYLYVSRVCKSLICLRWLLTSSEACLTFALQRSAKLCKKLSQAQAASLPQELTNMELCSPLLSSFSNGFATKPLQCKATKSALLTKTSTKLCRPLLCKGKARYATCQKVWSSSADFCSAKVRPTTKGAKGLA